MIKVPPIMELFQIIKIYISQPTLNFQKSYKRDQNMRMGARGRGSGDQINLIAVNNEKFFVLEAPGIKVKNSSF